jgi:hypothetical protein
MKGGEHSCINFRVKIPNKNVIYNIVNKSRHSC